MLTRREVTRLTLRALKVTVTHVSRSFSSPLISSAIQDIELSLRDVKRALEGSTKKKCFLSNCLRAHQSGILRN